jgi:hypothetical protein
VIRERFKELTQGRTFDLGFVPGADGGAGEVQEKLVAVETPTQLKQLMLADRWRSFQQGNRVLILAYRSWPTAATRSTSSTPPASSSETPKASSAATG